MNIFIINKKKLHIYILIFIVLLGFLLRIYNIKDNFFFAYDQARDAQRIQEIARGKDFKLLGPETDIPGLFHGPLFYYLLLPIYVFSSFDPNGAAIFFILFDLLGIFLMYVFGKRMTNNKTIGLIAALLWAISYQQLNFARFISNVSLLSVFSLIFFYGTFLFFVQKKQFGLVITSIGLALSIHANFICIYFILLLVLFYFIYKPSFKKQYCFYAATIVCILLSPFVLSEIKRQFLGLKTIFTFFSNDSHSSFQPADNIIKFTDRLNDSITYNFSLFPKWINIAWFSFMGFFIYRFSREKKLIIFLLLWIFSTAPLFIFNSGILNSPSLNGITTGGMILIVAITIYSIGKSSRAIVIPGIILFLILISNILLLKNDSFIPIRLFAYQNSTFKRVKEIVSYTYSRSQNKQFGICSVSNPLFINTLWSFAYSNIKKKINSLPYWTGPKQVLNINRLPYLREASKQIETIFLIIEPNGGIPHYAQSATQYLLDKQTILKEQKKFGDFIVEERILLNPEAVSLKQIKESKNLDLIISHEPRFSCYVTD